MWWTNKQKGHGGRIVLSAFLIKVSKHLALLVCFLILSRAAGPYPVDQLSLLGLTVLATLLHVGGRALHSRAVWTIAQRSRSR
jgi:hypothetical protein